MKRLLARCSAVMLGIALAGTVAAQPSFPEKPITIVLPYATGGSADMLARFAGDAIQKELGQPVIVESRPGSGGVIGTEYVARAKGDGYTLLLTASGSMAVNPYTYKIRYKPLEDFKQVTVLVDLPFVLVASPGLPIDNLEDLHTYAAKKQAPVTFGNAGMGTQQHLTQLMFASAVDVDLSIVPYKGSMPALNDLLGGHIDLMIDNTGVQTPYIQSGKVRPLFVTSPERVPVLPDVPTAMEAGLEGFESVAWFGLAAPAGTPDEVVSKLQQAVAKTFLSDEMKERFAELAMLPVALTPEETTERVKRDLKTFGALAEEHNLSPF